MATNYAVARDVVIEGASIEQEVSCNNNNLIMDNWSVRWATLTLPKKL